MIFIISERKRTMTTTSRRAYPRDDQSNPFERRRYAFEVLPEEKDPMSKAKRRALIMPTLKSRLQQLFTTRLWEYFIFVSSLCSFLPIIVGDRIPAMNLFLEITREITQGRSSRSRCRSALAILGARTISSSSVHRSHGQAVRRLAMVLLRLLELVRSRLCDSQLSRNRLSTNTDPSSIFCPLSSSTIFTYRRTSAFLKSTASNESFTRCTSSVSFEFIFFFDQSSKRFSSP